MENTISTSQDSLPDAEKDLEDLENAIMTTENEEENSDGDISENTDDTDESTSEETLEETGKQPTETSSNHW